MGDLALNFSRSEFKCPHCGRLVGPTTALVDVLQSMRTSTGERLHIVDGYRCAVYNRRVGGVEHSEHLVGNAADVPGGYATKEQWAAAGARGIGLRDGRVIHVDMRAGPAVVFVD